MNRVFTSLLLTGFLMGTGAVRADARLESAAGLAPIIEKAPGLLLVDAREEAASRQQPLAGSVPFQPGLAIRTGVIIVVADTEERALQLAQLLAATSGLAAYALKGGAEAWREMVERGEKERQAGAPPPSLRFVIPHNTCQQGKPLQEYNK